MSKELLDLIRIWLEDYDEADEGPVRTSHRELADDAAEIFRQLLENVPA